MCAFTNWRVMLWWCVVQVLTMMLEADIDGNNGIDFGEFKDVIFRVLDEEG